MITLLQIFILSKQNIKFIFAGDFNDFKPDVLLQQSASLRQVVQYPTHNDKNINLIITDLHSKYHPPFPIDPLLPDDTVYAKPSDHKGNMFFPLSDQNVHTKRTFESIVVRPIKQSQLEELGRWLQNQDWKTIENTSNTDNLSLIHI